MAQSKRRSSIVTRQMTVLTGLPSESAKEERFTQLTLLMAHQV
ncbi:MAG TPA: hypothetical protein VEF04_15550 [Blastocatellia bacterium]|nr:hypothetical protein [Blastocatellia bacterium]